MAAPFRCRSGRFSFTQTPFEQEPVGEVLSLVYVWYDSHMSFENMPQNGNTPESIEDKRRWDKKIDELDAYGKKEGEDVPIDQGIKESVAALNLMGIPTTASCSGRPEDHPREHKGGFPMLQGILEDDPKGNHSARESIERLLEEFNEDRSTEFTLQLNPYVSDGYRIESIVGTTDDGGEHVEVEGEDNRKQEDTEELRLGAQKEIEDFTEFLKERYYKK